MMDLRLAKLPDRMPVRRTVSISPGLNQALREHAALYAQTYGSDEPAAELIPAMLGAFLDGDQAFARWRRGAGKRDG